MLTRLIAVALAAVAGITSVEAQVRASIAFYANQNCAAGQQVQPSVVQLNCE